MTDEQREVFYAAALLLGSGAFPSPMQIEIAVEAALGLHREVYRATDPRRRYTHLLEQHRPPPRPEEATDG